MNLSFSATYTTNSQLFSPPIPTQLRRRRLYRRPRSQFEPPFHDLLSQLPSPNSVNFITPALGLASGVALYLSNRSNGNENPNPQQVRDLGEWILLSSPTPFNRFVLLRCPSVTFNGSELLDSGRMEVSGVDGAREGELMEKLEYQRVCVAAEDGGVISLDWPENLDLKEERGLDTTLLLVPGTTQGSMDSGIRSFVCHALNYGFFPIIMNPRGCAGSPLTTPRLFTAADSDDICTAIQFINKARPWTTLMGVGWGYGANMMTKYLANVGEKTPLTAVTCIDNPFDLEVASRSSRRNISVDQKLTSGLKDILQSNKELFQGKTKRFDVEKALLAKSLRDFEKAISMVSYGFESIEDFYLESSTHGVVGNVKIPVLFVQTDDDGTASRFSIPHSLIDENPFTSMLLCSCSPPIVTASSRSVISWCQDLTVEWLVAVELGLLKGRHPLLKDVDVTIKPSKGSSLVDDGASDNSANVSKLLDLSQPNSLKGYSVDPLNDVPEESDTCAGTDTSSGRSSCRNLELKDMGMREVDNGVLQETGAVVDADVVEEEGNPIDSEAGQVLQTAEVVMNMLDMAMPGTLTEEKKKKVLAAAGQGETLLMALQDVVPEDVREKLTATVSAFMRTQGTNLKFDGLLHMDSGLSSGLVSRIQENSRVLSSAQGSQDHNSSDEMNVTDNEEDGPNSNQLGVEKPAGSVRKEADELGNNHENDHSSKEKAAALSSEKGLETDANLNFPGPAEEVGGIEEAMFDEHKDQDGELAHTETKEDSEIQEIEEKSLDSLSDQNERTSSNVTEDALSPRDSTSGVRPMEREDNDSQKRDNANVRPALDQSISDFNSPNINVTQAWDALTGMDDSTQVAVNSVFGVIEDMITQLEDSEDENEAAENDGKDKKIDSAYEKHGSISEHSLEKKEENNDHSAQSDTSNKGSQYNNQEIGMDSQLHSGTGCIKKQPLQNPSSLDRDGIDGSQESNISNHRGGERFEENDEYVDGEPQEENSDKPRYTPNVPHYITAHSYEGSFHNDYHKYPLSKLPTESLDIDSTTALLFDYFPEEDQWKLLEQPADSGSSISNDAYSKGDDKKVKTHSLAKTSCVEPSYVVFDMEKEHEPISEHDLLANMNEVEIDDDKSDKIMYFVKSVILDCLKVEVDQKLTATDIKEMQSYLARDLEHVADAVSLAVGHDKEHNGCLEGEDITIDCNSEKMGTLHGDHVIAAIVSSVQETSYLRTVLPLGVIAGSSLAALRKFFDVAPVLNDVQREVPTPNQAVKLGVYDEVSAMEIDWLPSDKSDKSTSSDISIGREGEKVVEQNQGKDVVMAGSVTTDLGASSLLVQQQEAFKSIETVDGSSKSLKEKDNDQKVAGSQDEATLEKSQNNIVTNLAEKAMAFASPVVPTKEGGEVDQERIVGLLAGLGQRGGMFRLVGKVALLWGGIRGAMSLTERLILFLHIAERPWFQRVLGFVGMMLVLWSPVVVPLLPTLICGQMTHMPSRIAKLACVFGLYAAVLILVVMWGKRLRGFENPLEEYGLDMTSWPKIRDLLKGMIGGVLIVLSIHSVNSLLGYVSFARPPTLPSSSIGVVTCLNVYGHMFSLVGRGIVMATSTALAEELLFRSWLPEEIATDLGYHRGNIISGLIFALYQRSLWAIPGMWLLSLGLAGARQRSEGSLSIPVGLRVGVIASSFVLQKGDFLTYNPNIPLWLMGSSSFQPFSGAVGFAFSILFAISLYPRQNDSR